MLEWKHSSAGGLVDLGIEEGPDPALLIIRGSSSLRGFAEVLGAAPSAEPNRFICAEGRVIAWLGPDEWLLVGTPGEEGRLCSNLEAALQGVHHAVSDVSGSRSLFRLCGAAAVDLLSAASPMDFHPRAFKTGACSQTSFARTSALVLLRDETPRFDVFVGRSYATYVRTWLSRAGEIVALGTNSPGAD